MIGYENENWYITIVITISMSNSFLCEYDMWIMITQSITWSQTTENMVTQHTALFEYYASNFLDHIDGIWNIEKSTTFWTCSELDVANLTELAVLEFIYSFLPKSLGFVMHCPLAIVLHLWISWHKTKIIK